MTDNPHQHVVILGGGFGGLYTALEFEKYLSKKKTLRVTLINSQNFFLFTPMLHEVAASDLDATTIVNPIRKMLKRVSFFKGDIESIDIAKRAITLSHGEGQHPHTMTFDHLVMAMGSETNYFNLPGLQEHALGMKSLGDAFVLRNQLIDLLEEADFECSTDSREPLLSVVVAGGGFSGVETMGAINDFMRTAIKSYKHLHENQLRLVLVHPGDTLLPELGKKLGEYAQKKLAQRKVEIKLNTRVQGCTDKEVQLSDGTTIASNTIIWTAGTTPSSLLAALPCAKEHGKVLVNEFLEVVDYPGVWAVGDCASVPDKKTGKPYPPTAQNAYRQGPLAARNILAALNGGEKKPFAYEMMGQLAAIGHRTGVARIFGISFSGYLAWWLWRTVYLLKLPRFEKKLRVVMDWTLDVFFSKDLVQVLTRPSARRAQFESKIPQPPAESEARPDGRPPVAASK